MAIHRDVPIRVMLNGKISNPLNSLLRLINYLSHTSVNLSRARRGEWKPISVIALLVNLRTVS